jgi:hypothetical protein
MRVFRFFGVEASPNENWAYLSVLEFQFALFVQRTDGRSEHNATHFNINNKNNNNIFQFHAFIALALSSLLVFLCHRQEFFHYLAAIAVTLPLYNSQQIKNLKWRPHHLHKRACFVPKSKRKLFDQVPL